MPHTTRGIVLNYIKYQETSLIVRIFTELFGKQSYLVKGVRVAKSKHAIALFQPLMPLDMLVLQSRNSTLHHLIEAKCHRPISNLLGDLKKATVAVFLTELFHKAVSETQEEAKLFTFLLQSVVALDVLTQDHAAFYLDFMLSLASHLGFGCGSAAEINAQLLDSGYCPFSMQELSLLDSVMQKRPVSCTIDNREQVRNLTIGLLHFLQLHVGTLDRLNSLKILQIMNE